MTKITKIGLILIFGIITTQIVLAPYNSVVVSNVVTEKAQVVPQQVKPKTVDPFDVMYDYNQITDPLLIQKGDLKAQYPEGTCELAAKTYQKEYGGQLVFVAPIDENGGWIQGKYAGAWLNLYKGKYIDYTESKVFDTKEEAQKFYTESMQTKHHNKNVTIKMFIYGTDVMPYPMTWNY